MKYLRVFETEGNYTEYKDSREWITPNISLIRSSGRVTNKPYIPLQPVMVGDVVYWDGSKVKTTPLSSWNISLGTPVGVVVIPEGDEPNPEYYKELDGGNVLSDFNGLSNTQTLVGLGTGYTAANAAYKYNDGFSNLQWYLPAMGELGYLMPRFKEINNTITILGGVAVDNYNVWSSSEYSSYYVYDLDTNDGYVAYSFKSDKSDVRPFAILDDGRVRIVSLMPVDSNGNQSSSYVEMIWGPTGTDTSLTNFTKVSTTDNAGSTSSGSDSRGYLPSDNFRGVTSFADPKTKYSKSGGCELIPSPYLGGEYNVNFITFTIDGTEYQAEEGMTWEDWCSSYYVSPLSYMCDAGRVITSGGRRIEYSGAAVHPSDIIIYNYNYNRGVLVGGGSD